jgi:hypothetical protein
MKKLLSVVRKEMENGNKRKEKQAMHALSMCR